MNWKKLLAYITGSVDQELLLRNEYLATENRILRNQINHNHERNHQGMDNLLFFPSIEQTSLAQERFAAARGLEGF